MKTARLKNKKAATSWISHRGDATRHPENTLKAYQKAISSGFKAVEMDVVLSKDGTIYCSHNHDLEKETDGFGYFFEKTVSEIDQHFAVNPTTKIKEKIPKLDNVLSELPKDILVNIEIKSKGLFDIHIAIPVVQMIKKHRRESKCIVSSFNPIILRIVRCMDHQIVTGYLIEAQNPLLLYSLAGGKNIHPRADILTDDLISYCKRRDITIVPWTVNNKPAKNHLYKMGITQGISDK